ncbi:MAG TPA: sulfatase/phosphatase domain-containing protein, partial [Pricia sp.]|nr:sulfatase/phosphatase domain-containing protein [Pricia sp.]
IISWPGHGLTNTRLKELTSTIDLYPTFLSIAGLTVPEYLPGRSLLPLLKGEETVWRKFLFTEYHVHSNHNPYPQRTVRNEKYKMIYNPLSGTENPGYGFTLKKTVKISEEMLLKNADAGVRMAYRRMKNPPEYELYDLISDPFEMKNISEDENYAGILQRLKEALRSWQIRTDDPLIDEAKARQLFEMVQETGTTGPRKVVPYSRLMDPKMKFE